MNEMYKYRYINPHKMIKHLLSFYLCSHPKSNPYPCSSSKELRPKKDCLKTAKLMTAKIIHSTTLCMSYLWIVICVFSIPA